MKVNASKKKIFIIFACSVFALFLIKVYLNSFLLAEDGDTYDFFRMAYYFRIFQYPSYAKRMPLLPLILAISAPSNFILWGRVVSSLFYFGSIFVFYSLLGYYVKDKTLKSIFSLIFAFNIVVLNNSFFINSDNIFLFLVLLFILIYKKYGLKIPILALIAALAFYTRVEGILLFLSLGIILFAKKRWEEVLRFSIFALVFLSPFLIRNLILFHNPLFTHYAEDDVGFNVTLKNIYLGFANYIYTVGGVWFLPSLALVFNKKDFKTRNIKKLEVLTFLLLSGLLILWSPVLRLYSVPVSFTLIYFAYLLDRQAKKLTFNTKFYVNIALLFLVSCAGYILCVQVFSQKDLGMFKIAKLVSLLFSIPVVVLLVLYLRNFYSKNVLLWSFAFFVVFINLFVFIDRFRFTRYKYLSIVETVQAYNANYKNTGNAGYVDESGVEMWYLQDFDEKYSLLKSHEINFVQWVFDANVKYLIITHEMGGSVDYRVKKFKEQIDKLDPLVEFKTPFFGGDTKLIDISTVY